MRLFKITAFALVLVLSPLSSLADLNVSIGAGKNIMRKEGLPFERSAAVGFNFDMKDFFIRPEVGYFLDVSGVDKSSLFANSKIGFRALSSVGPELHLAFGPGYLQNPDNILGGHFQFFLEGGIGLHGDSFFIGLIWAHISSAGFNMPNHGRDFIQVQLRVLNI